MKAKNDKQLSGDDCEATPTLDWQEKYRGTDILAACANLRPKAQVTMQHAPQPAD